jgi:hypothetical protein
MYQGWCQENDLAVRNWLEFVEMAAQETNKDVAELASALQKTHWFQWQEEK